MRLSRSDTAHSPPSKPPKYHRRTERQAVGGPEGRGDHRPIQHWPGSSGGADDGCQRVGWERVRAIRDAHTIVAAAMVPGRLVDPAAKDRQCPAPPCSESVTTADVKGAALLALHAGANFNSWICLHVGSVVMPDGPESMRDIAARYLELAKTAVDPAARNRLLAYAIIYQDLALQMRLGLPKSRKDG